MGARIWVYLCDLWANFGGWVALRPRVFLVISLGVLAPWW